MKTKIRIPAEWEKQSCIWTCWPSDEELWQDDINGARAEVGAMIESLITPHNGNFTKVKLLVSDDQAKENALKFFGDKVEIFEIPFGDIWLRDTGPIFGKDENGGIALCFGFNGWGGKYVLDHDNEVNEELASSAKSRAKLVDFVLEGGSIDTNGEGVFLTTTQCLLNKNRNPNLSKAEIEDILRNELGAKLILWLEDGLLNDHTDGHIDNIARFIGTNKIICQSSFGDDDPNKIILDKIYSDLCEMRNLNGDKFEIIRAPSPGIVKNQDGEIVPASHMNFLISNGKIIMPHYGTKSADQAMKILSDCFENYKVFGINATHVLTGGGSFHCITQQQPE